MSKEISGYKEGIKNLLDLIAGEEEAIQQAADVIARAVKDDKMVHVIGPGGHSNMAVEEVLWRAGGLLMWNAILDAGTNLIHGAKRSNLIERTPGYAISVLDAYRVGQQPGEVMIIVNAYGINPMTIDTAEECRRRGVTTIAVTSSSFAKLVPAGHKARHPSGKNLYEIVDIYIDNHLPEGDAIVTVEGMDTKTGSTSTFCNCFAMNCISIETVKRMLELGITPPVIMSANMPGGDEHNKAIEDKYIGRIKHLM